MNAKWYLSTLIIVLTLLGSGQKQDPVANQEIVVEFVNSTISSKDVQNAIASVKNQLKNVGAKGIKVQERENGTLKISYYSNVNVASIKEVFSKENHLVLAGNKTESGSQSSDNQSYNIDIYEITKGTETSSLGGKFVLEIKYDYDRFSNPNVYVPFNEVTNSKVDRLVKTAYKINRNIAIAIDNTSHKKPEVRAGPNC